MRGCATRAGARNVAPASLLRATQLRIYLAGVWHNIVIAVVALLLLRALPVALSPVYARANGAVVVDVQDTSPLFGELVAGTARRLEPARP